MASTIGLKIANGEFYPLVEENSQVKKRLVLTTVHDRQRSVQIDLYKSVARSMVDAVYVGSLVVEKIKSRSKGEPSIEMIISSTKDGNLNAEAIDLDSGPQGEHQYLNVSLRSFDEDSREYEIPDFELEQNESPPTGLYEKSRAIKAKEPSGIPLAAIIIAASVALIILAAGIWYFLFWEKNTFGPSRAQSQASGQNRQVIVEAVPQEAKPQETPPPPVQTVQEAAPPLPVIEAPAAPPPAQAPARTRPPAPVASYKVPATIPRDGAPYRIRWGDTLWDISEAFYRNPWLYPRIARFNNIRNPDRIISGTVIRVPPRN